MGKCRQNGTGSVIINGRDINDYFGLETLKLVVNQPLVTADLLGKVDVVVTVAGGGVSARLALSVTACPALWLL